MKLFIEILRYQVAYFGVPTCIGMVALMLFGIFQIYAGYMGLAIQFGTGLAVANLVLLATFRITLPSVLGCYLYAKNILGWDSFYALLFASPGLAFMFPGVFSRILGWPRR